MILAQAAKARAGDSGTSTLADGLTATRSVSPTCNHRRSARTLFLGCGRQQDRPVEIRDVPVLAA